MTTTASHAARLYHLGATAPKRSTLADANAQRPAELFGELFESDGGAGPAWLAQSIWRGDPPDRGLALGVHEGCRVRLDALINGLSDAARRRMEADLESVTALFGAYLA